jgi:hypothetical protein
MRTVEKTKSRIKVADEVWIACALLHRENPNRADFEVAEIVERARREALTPSLRPGVYIHALQHCVANRPPDPGRYRMLVETGPGRRRLYREGDSYHPARHGSKSFPAREEIPTEHWPLLDWYESEYNRKERPTDEKDSILELAGLGKGLWKDEDPDEYVRRLREGWE